MSPVIIAVISDLHLRGKLVSRPIKATSPNFAGAPSFSSITKSNARIQMSTLEIYVGN